EAVARLAPGFQAWRLEARVRCGGFQLGHGARIGDGDLDARVHAARRAVVAAVAAGGGMRLHRIAAEGARATVAPAACGQALGHAPAVAVHAVAHARFVSGNVERDAPGVALQGGDDRFARGESEAAIGIRIVLHAADRLLPGR